MGNDLIGLEHSNKGVPPIEIDGSKIIGNSEKKIWIME